MTDELEPISGADLERLRADFAQADAEAGEGEAIDPEQIWAAVHGQLPPEQCAAIVDRLHRDPALALEWRLALELRDAEAPAELEPEQTEPANDRGYWRRYWYTGALTLLAAAVIVLIVLPGNDERAPSDTLQLDDDTGDTLREAQTEAAIQSELREAALPASAFELRWTAVPGALRYELQVTTRALDPVYAAPDLGDNQATVPANVLDSLPAGTELIWRVTAVMPDGQRRSSAAMSVTLQ